MTSRTRRSTVLRRAMLVASAAGIVAATASSAFGAGAGTVFWANNNFASNSISSAALDGSGGANPLPRSFFQSTYPNVFLGTWSTSVDPVTERIYWATNGGTFANWPSGSAGLTGGSPQSLSIGITNPQNLSVVPATGRIYWANDPGISTSTISWAALDGSASGTLYSPNDFPAGVLNGPQGVAPDPASGRIYWLNSNNSGNFTVGYAKLDGTGGGGVVTPQRGAGTGCTTQGQPQGMIVDSVGGKFYFDYDVIRRTNLDGTGCEEIPTGIGGSGRAFGLALDYATNRLYMGTGANEIRYIDLADNSSRALSVTGATLSFTASPTLFTRPALAPVITGERTTGSTLRCDAGVAADAPGVNLYRSARTTTYAWSHDGSALAGEVGESITATRAGSYVCTATATNVQGSTTASSPAVAVTTAAASGTGGGSGSGTLPKGATVPAALAKAGLPVSSDGVVRLPLSCPAGLPGRCAASGYLTVTTSVQVSNAFGLGENAKRKYTRVIARFKGLQIASGTTALNDVRLRRRIYSALRKAGVRRTPADLYLTTSVQGEEPVSSKQRLWLRIPPLKKRIPVTG